MHCRQRFSGCCHHYLFSNQVSIHLYWLIESNNCLVRATVITERISVDTEHPIISPALCWALIEGFIVVYRCNASIGLYSIRIVDMVCVCYESAATVSVAVVYCPIHCVPDKDNSDWMMQARAVMFYLNKHEKLALCMQSAPIRKENTADVVENRIFWLDIYELHVQQPGAVPLAAFCAVNSDVDIGRGSFINWITKTWCEFLRGVQ